MSESEDNVELYNRIIEDGGNETLALARQQRKEIQSLRREIAVLQHGLNSFSTMWFAQNNELAAQRRTIATLRARLRNSKRKLPLEFLALFYNRYISVDRERDSIRDLALTRIAAIRNFGALPGEPLMPGCFYDGAWHAKDRNGCKAVIGYDHIRNAWTWWVVGFAGYVVEESYQAARDNAEAALRKLGALP